MRTKNTAIVLCLLVLSDQILVGLTDSEDSEDSGSEADESGDDAGEATKNADGDDEGGGEEGADEGGGEVGADEKGVKAGKNDKNINLNVANNGVPNQGILGASGGPIGNIVGTGSQMIRRGTLSGLARVLDDRFSEIDCFGNPHGGMPEDLTGHIRFCGQFIYSGLYALIYVIIRYPLKLVSKAITLTGAVSFLKSYAMWCINPIVIMGFTTDGRKINTHLERLAQFRKEFTKRMIWITDKAKHEDRQMYSCCSWHDYKRKIYEEAPESYKFSRDYFRGLYKLIEWFFCMKYQEGSKACEAVDLSATNAEPNRVVPQSFYTTAFELFDKFI